MRKMILAVAVVLFLGTMIVSGCSSQKGPAEAAITGVEEALNASKAEASKYVPDQVKALEDGLAGLKEKFQKGDYKAVIAEATPLLNQAKGLADAAKAKKEELTKAWTEMSATMPKMVEAIQGKVDELSKTRKLPANLTKEGFEETKAGLSAIKEEWAKAQENFTAGNIAEAVTATRSIREKGAKVMETLGIPVPGPATTETQTPKPLG